jgi:hypothetical protein
MHEFITKAIKINVRLRWWNEQLAALISIGQFIAYYVPTETSVQRQNSTELRHRNMDKNAIVTMNVQSRFTVSSFIVGWIFYLSLLIVVLK